nr:unnamed protein product [Lactococcus lactis subsp. cremoris] [Lactococcus cremoris subsp. cremoris MG1363]
HVKRLMKFSKMAPNVDTMG